MNLQGQKNAACESRWLISVSPVIGVSKVVFLKILNTLLCWVFANQITYDYMNYV